MNVRSFCGRACRWALAYAVASLAWGCDLITDKGDFSVTWRSGAIPFQVKFATTGGLTAGTTQTPSIQAAMQSWNRAIDIVRLTSLPWGRAVATFLSAASMGFVSIDWQIVRQARTL